MKENEWIVSPKKLKENQIKSIANDIESKKDTNWKNFEKYSICFVAGMSLVCLLLKIWS